ncbi:glycosyltransferase [Campylobacterota bacterium DY0563]
MNIQIEGTYENQYSLSIVNKALALSLEKYLNANVKLDATTYHYDYMNNYKNLDENIKHMINKKFDNVDISIRNIFPPYTTGMLGYHKIMGPYAWEESKFPQEYVQWFNNSLTMIFAVSTYVKEILEKNGVNIPIKVIGNIVEEILEIDTKPLDFDLTNKFKLLHVSSCFPRKGTNLLIQAFDEISIDNITLIIKTFPNEHNKTLETINNYSYKLSYSYEKNINIFSKGSKDILYIDKDFSREELKFLYKQSDVLVSPSFSEGFGLPLAEAMLLDLPVISTAYGGQMDFCNEKTAWLVDYELTQASSHFNLQNSYWAKPKIESLKTKILEVYNCDKKNKKDKIDFAKDFILKNYSSKKVAKRVNDALTNY